MHCKACDVTLNDFELSRTYEDGTHVDLCNRCYSFIEDDVDASANVDLMSDSDDVEYESYDDTQYYDSLFSADVDAGMWDDRDLS